MADFETVKSEVRDFGSHGFICVERRRVSEAGRPPSEFLLVARGYYLKDGTARRRNFVTLPDDPEVRKFVAAALADL